MRSYGLHITLGRQAEVHLRVRGEVDIVVAAQLQDSIRCAAAAHEGHLVAVDMADVTFVDSSGISALVQAQLALNEEGRRLVVRNANGVVARVFDLTGTGDFLGLYDHDEASSAPGMERSVSPALM